MRVTVDVAHWLSALRVLAPSLARTNPFRKSWCALSAAPNQVTLRVASIDWDTEYVLPADVAEPGEAFADADLIRTLPFGRFAEPVECHTTGKALVVRSGTISYTLALLPSENAPALPRDLVPAAKAEGPALARTLLLGASAARQRGASPSDPERADDTERDGAWIDIGAERVTVSSTDRVRVARASTPADVELETKVALPMHAALALSRAAAHAEIAVLHRSKRTPSAVVSITAGPATVRVRTLAALPPDPSRVTLSPRDTTSTLRLDASRLADALRAALAIAGTDPLATVRLVGRRAQLTIRVAAGGSEAVVSMPVERASGEDADMVLHARPLLAVLAPLGHATGTLAMAASGVVEISAAVGQITYQGVLAGAAPPRKPLPDTALVGSGATSAR